MLYNYANDTLMVYEAIVSPKMYVSGYIIVINFTHLKSDIRQILGEVPLLTIISVRFFMRFPKMWLPQSSSWLSRLSHGHP